jgi:hypothetical protein
MPLWIVKRDSGDSAIEPDFRNPLTRGDADDACPSGKAA